MNTSKIQLSTTNGGVSLRRVFSSDLIALHTRFQSNNIILKGAPSNDGLVETQMEEEI